MLGLNQKHLVIAAAVCALAALLLSPLAAWYLTQTQMKRQDIALREWQRSQEQQRTEALSLLHAMESRLQQMENTAHPPSPPPPPPPPPPPEKPQEFSALPMLIAQVAALEQRMAAQAQKMEALAQQSKGSQHQAVLFLAYDRLREALLSGQPFEDAWQDLARIGAGNSRIMELLHKLQPSAMQGIPDIPALTRTFEKALAEMLKVEQQGDDLRANLASLITIRKVGMQPGTTPEAVLARAEAHLQQKDLAAAVAEVEKLQEPASQAFAPWLTQARHRLTLPAILVPLREAVLTAPTPDIAS